MSYPITLKQIVEHLAEYSAEDVTFQFPDGLPAVIAYVQDKGEMGAIVTLSDEIPESGEPGYAVYRGRI